MNIPQEETKQETKQVVARSTAIYRRVTIIETAEGCSFFIGQMRYDCLDLAEAKAAIDAMYLVVAQIN